MTALSTLPGHGLKCEALDIAAYVSVQSSGTLLQGVALGSHSSTFQEEQSVLKVWQASAFYLDGL